MGHVLGSFVLSAGIFTGVILCWELGRLFSRRVARARGAEAAGVGAVDGAIFGLMGLLLAFSFSGAMSRWDARRALVVEEANDIGTAYLRIDLLPDAAQPGLRDALRRYVDLRIETYRAGRYHSDPAALLAQTGGIQREVWRRAIEAVSSEGGDRARMLLLPALNAVFDIASTRAAAVLYSHPPEIINVLLITLVLASALLAGMATSQSSPRSWAHVICFALAISVSVFVIIDLEYPRRGLIRIDAVDQLLLDVRQSMD